jgi:hypothetical protein
MENKNIEIQFTEETPDENIQAEFKQLISDYIYTFKNLPPVGLRLKTEDEFTASGTRYCTGCFIDQIDFYKNQILFWLDVY